MANRSLAFIISATETALRTRPSACLGPSNITLSGDSRGSSGTRPGEPDRTPPRATSAPTNTANAAWRRGAEGKHSSGPPWPKQVAKIRELEGRIRVVERQLDAVAEQLPVVDRLRSIPGIGLVTATALLAAVADIQRFQPGRKFASYWG